MLLLTLSGAASAAEPVVFLHGFASRPDIWRGAEAAMEGGPYDPVLVAWAPERGMDARMTAVEVLLPAIEQRLAAQGHPPDAAFHVVAHSMSGLLVRYLLEHARPDLGERVLSLVTISTPHRGARTGVANLACGFWTSPWRSLGCELRPGSELIRELGPRKPAEVGVPYLAIGVESAEPMVPVPAYDADGDGRALGHDKAVMAESAMLDGEPFVVWRAWGRLGDHFGVSCSAEVGDWIVGFLAEGVVPETPTRRVRATDACAGISKRQWRAERAAESEAP